MDEFFERPIGLQVRSANRTEGQNAFGNPNNEDGGEGVKLEVRPGLAALRVAG